MGAFRMRQEPQQPDFDVLPPSHQRRTAKQISSGFTEDVSDAHFVVVDDMARRGDKTSFNDNKRFSARQAAGDRPHLVLLEAFALKAEAFLERFSDRAFAVMVTLIFGMVFMLASGLAATQILGGPVRTNALDITHATLTPQDKNGMRVLLINGIVDNRGSGSQQVPRIRADILNGDRLVASTFIDTGISSLKRGHSRGFAAKIQHPGGKSPQLRLSFVEQDATAQ